MLGKKVCIVIITLILTLSPINSIFAVETAKSEEDIKAVIERFYDLSYESIMALEMKDMSSVLDEKSQFGRNFLIAFQRNIVENKYSLERGYTNFKRQRLPITVSVDVVAREGNKIRVKVNIEGDRSKGYPMFVCLGENNFLLKNESGNWIVESVQADDVLFTMLNERFFKEIDESAVHKAVDEEYRVETAEDSIQEKENRVYPYEDHYYSVSRAIEYAEEFVFGGNGYFYVAPYDCTNFISQCVSYGFGSGYSYSSPSSYRMVSGIWYAGSGGGYPAWETVETHWNYMFQNKTNREGPKVLSQTWSTLSDGGIMQIDFDGDGVYDHSVICVSKSSGRFAQHSGNHYGNYEDYQGNKRFYRPLYFRTY